jgi:hypothetical protein
MPLWIAATCDACGQTWCFSGTTGRLSEHNPAMYGGFKKPEAAGDIVLSGPLPKGWEWRGNEARTCMTICPKCSEAKRDAAAERKAAKKAKPAENPLKLIRGGIDA